MALAVPQRTFIATSASRPSRHAAVRPLGAYSGGGGGTTLGQGPSSSAPRRLLKSAARVSMLALMRAMAISKLYQAQHVSLVADHVRALSSTVKHAELRDPTSSHAGPAASAENNVEQQQQQQDTFAPPDAPSLAFAVDAGALDSVPDIPTVIPSSTAEVAAFSAAPDSAPVAQAVCPQLGLLECALWTDELRHLQARRQALAQEVAAQTAYAHTRREDSSLVNTGPEFCAITCTLMADERSDVLRTCFALRDQIHQLSASLAWSGNASVCPRTPPTVLGEGGDVMCKPEADLDAEVRELQRQWFDALQDVVYQQVQLAQLRQLPALPRRRATLSAVSKRVVGELSDRLTALQRYVAVLN